MADPRRAPNPHIPRDNAGRRLEAAVDIFLSQPRFSDETRRSYSKTLTALTAALEAAGAEPTAASIEAAAQLRWGTVAPATWNRHAATIRSFLRYAARHGLLGELDVDLDRRREPADRTRALPHAALKRLWSRRDVALREKTLWRLLYETAARAGEALSLNVEDLDLPARCAVIRGKNGELDYVHWQTGTGHLLSRLIAGRPSGPVFLTDRRAGLGRGPAAADLCPHTGRARLSYRRAEELFREATGGRTLHQLRHSAITHLAEQNVALPLLMAKRHTSLRSLQKYARPGVDAVAKLTADHDPARRRR
jgi:integrase